MTSIKNDLFLLQDKKYAAFQSSLLPEIDADKIIGVRIPLLRSYAKKLYSDERKNDFLSELPHNFYEENLLHMLVLSFEKDFDICINLTLKFIPYIDNWAVCDVPPSKVLGQHKDVLIEKIKQLINNPGTYFYRYGTGLLMRYYLDEDFKTEYLELAAAPESSDYYAKMMTAWFFATALAKQWNSTLPFLENRKLEKWIHNKTIQKAVESHRITDSQKSFLKSLRIN